MQKHEIRDHLNNIYPSAAAMCAAYNITYAAYIYRINNMHWDLEKALTTPINADKITKDHLGNTYPTFGKMCEYYNISPNTLKFRLENLKWPLEKALTTPPEVKKYKDHLGNEYNTMKELCKQYNKMYSNYICT